MRSRNEIVTELTQPGVIAVVRALRKDQVPALTEALLAGGVIAIEITLTTPQAFEAIKEAKQKFGSQALIGVGSVLDVTSARAAIHAGAEFVVSPVSKFELIPIAHDAERAVMLGAYTPTEAQAVHERGADFVKLFPADTLGAAYIKALRAPMPHLKFVPTGGVDLRTIPDFFAAGCAAVGACSSLISRDILQKDDWAQLTENARKFVAAAQAAKANQKSH